MAGIFDGFGAGLASLGNTLSTAGSNVGGALNSGLQYAGQNAEGLGALAGGIGGLAGAYTNYKGMQNSQNLANQQMAMLQADRQRELARQGEAQAAFDSGFSNSGFIDPNKKQGLAATATA